MLVLDGVVVYSASDLAAAARCDYALLRAFDARLKWGPPVAAGDDLLARTARLGDEHEQRHLDDLRAQLGDNATIIGRPAHTWEGLIGAAEATREAVARRSPLIAQAAMFDGRFLGFADFLVLEEGGYRLRDTKLARSVKVTALLQLAAYADALGRAGVPILDDVELALGNGRLVSYPVSELLPVYLSRRRALQELLDGHYVGGTPVRWGDDSVRACLRCPECQVEIEQNNDLLLVAGLRTTQRARLIDAGITTVTQLAEHCGSIAGLPAAASDALALQARLQTSAVAEGEPAYEVVAPLALSGLPAPSPGDLFFDFEGDPLWTADGRTWGLEYLFGVLGADGVFTPIWAHDRIEERQALRRFLDIVRERRERYPDMHVYHYASYERTALLKLAGNFGVGEEEVDDLLRGNVLVDLYPLVRNSIRVGTASYSLKYLEPLYMGEELRTGDVTTASDSIIMYEKYSDLLSNGNAEEATAVLAEIEEYNRYDCRSTRKLRDWLLARARDHDVAYREPTQQREKTKDPIDEDETAFALMDFAGDELAGRTAEQQAVAMIAAARGYHKREDKPYWWSHYQRMTYPVDEWADTSGVFMIERVHVEEDWRDPQGRERKSRRRLRLRGALESGQLDRKTMNAIYAAPAPATLAHQPSGLACNTVTIDHIDDPVDPTEIVVTEKSGGTDGETHHQLPFALTPPPPIPTDGLKTALDAVATDVKTALPHLPAAGYVDILARRPPRTHSAQTLPRTGDDVGDITAAVLDLDRSYLAVHGPPGCGKTYTAASVIARLLNEHGWRVGVVAQSHSVVEHLLDEIVAAGVNPRRVGKRPKKPGGQWERAWQPVKDKDYPAFIAEEGGCVIGGTAWDFANPGRVLPGSLDLLVIEEAGQFCLAQTIAVAAAAQNLLLLGDPQQLPQVSSGTHAEPVDESALGWLVDGASTLDPSLGYFLARSWRMHPSVCGPVSRLSYGGRLASVEEVTAARSLLGREPGVHDIAVEHDGNSTDSVEEAERIVAEVSALMGSQWTDECGARQLGPSDVLVVAAYNAQVQMIRSCLEKAGLLDVHVGTVDKFQGRQAPVVFFSLAASSAEDVPRGISFLLNRNRINVAISRAKYVAYIVRSPRLTEYLPSSPASLVELGGFLSLTAQLEC
jgi:predicted RecB family nuclease